MCGGSVSVLLYYTGEKALAVGFVLPHQPNKITLWAKFGPQATIWHLCFRESSLSLEMMNWPDQYLMIRDDQRASEGDNGFR